MIKPLPFVVLAAAITLALTACSSSNSTQKSAESQLSAIKSAMGQGSTGTGAAAPSNPATSSDVTTPSDAATSSDVTTSDASTTSSDSTTAGDSSNSSSAGASATDPASVDVCALLTPADGASVAQAKGLGTFAAAKDDRGIPGSSACKFSFGGVKSVIMEVRAGSFIGEYVLDPKVNGLGDEAYDGGTSPAMRVGDLLVTAEMNDLSDAVTLDLLRKMAPNMK